MAVNSSKGKRKDIQGMRAIAIIGVLLFHLSPKRFVNGFLGVDIFFVLSGYLMSSILSRETNIDSSIIWGFYIRRFKRIVPIYSVMLATLTVIVPLIILPNDISHFTTDLKWALAFAENMQNVLKKHDYWEEVFSSPILLHAWSLGVEMQYYLIVPFIMIFTRIVLNISLRIVLLFVLVGVSYSIHFFSSNTVSFGLLFARVWQFLTGTIFFELEKFFYNYQYQGINHDSGYRHFIKIGTNTPTLVEHPWITSLMGAISYCGIVYLFWLLIFSITETISSRLIVTVGTGILLTLGKFTNNCILSHKTIQYIGDLSYVLYLAHWPIITLYKYYLGIYYLTVQDMALCLVLTFIISVFLHHSLEQLFITSSTLVSALFVTVIYMWIIAALLFDGMNTLSKYYHSSKDSMFSADPWNTNIFNIFENDSAMSHDLKNASSTLEIKRNIQEAINWNQAETKLVYFKNLDGCVKDVEAEKWTNFKDEPSLRCVAFGNGTAKVLIIGNSYGYRAFPFLHRLFAGRYSKLRLFTMSARVFLTKDYTTMEFAELEKIVIKKFQPDITFLIEKDSHKTLMKPIIGKVENDPITIQIQEAINILSTNSKMVVVDQQYFKPNFTEGIAHIIQKRLQMGKYNFHDLGITRKEYEMEFSNEILRMATISSRNVIVNRVQEQLCPGEYCYFYNRRNMHSYIGDVNAHLTSEGLKLLEPKYKEIIEKFLLKHN